MNTIVNTIVIGRNKEGVQLLPWNNNNGMIIAGVSGSGKSQTASLFLTQYAYNGAKIILGDYGASLFTGESLTERVAHLQDALLVPPVSNAKGIIEYIEMIQQIGKDRQAGKAEMFPLIFAIDEFSAFVLSAGTTKLTRKVKIDDEYTETSTAQTYLEKLIESIITLRKYNIRFMLIGQEWAQLKSSGIRSLRSNISTQVIHKLDNNLAGLFGFTTSDEKRTIMNLGVGRVFYKGAIYQVPLLDDVFIAKTVTKIAGTRVTIENKPRAVYTRETKKIYKPCDKRWTNTHFLAHLLDVEFKSLRDRRKYDRQKRYES